MGSFGRRVAVNFHRRSRGISNCTAKTLNSDSLRVGFCARGKTLSWNRVTVQQVRCFAHAEAATVGSKLSSDSENSDRSRDSSRVSNKITSFSSFLHALQQSPSTSAEVRDQIVRSNSGNRVSVKLTSGGSSSSSSSSGSVTVGYGSPGGGSTSQGPGPGSGDSGDDGKGTPTSYNEIPTYPSRPVFDHFRSPLRPASQVVVFDGNEAVLSKARKSNTNTTTDSDPPSSSSSSSQILPSSMPLYQTSTFRAPDAENFGPYDYTRSGNPTRTALEVQTAMLDGAVCSFAFSTGMAALAILCRYVSVVCTSSHINNQKSLVVMGGRIFCSDDIYGGMHRLLTKVHAPVGGLQTQSGDRDSVMFVPTYDLDKLTLVLKEEIRASIEGKTGYVRLLHTESPSNPRLKITDMEKVGILCKHLPKMVWEEVVAEGGGSDSEDSIQCPPPILLSIDSTAMSPLRTSPLNLGADLVIHSATKWLSGHADTMGGIVSCSTEELAQKVGFLQNAEGTALAPFDCWLILRGMKTLSIRLDKSEENARIVARFLGLEERVLRIYFTETGGRVMGRKFSNSGDSLLKRKGTSLSDDSESDLSLKNSRMPGNAGRMRHFQSPQKERVTSAESLTTEEETAILAKFQLTPEDEETHYKQASGCGALISFETGDLDFSKRFMQACRIFKITVSFGSVNSLVEIPCAMSHASIEHDPSSATHSSPIPADLVRLSVGVEDIEDLLQDLRQAFAAAKKYSSVEEIKVAAAGAGGGGGNLKRKTSTSSNLLLNRAINEQPRLPEGAPN